jgi:hypothetical protein
MNYPYSISPNIQAAMLQAMQAIMSGGPLPPHCFIVTIPIQQAQQIFPQLMLNYASGGGATMYPQQYGQVYQPQISSYPAIQAPSQPVAPYSNYYSQGYNYPVVPYVDHNNKSKKKASYGKREPLQPHSNVYNSSSFDSHMDNLSWSRLFSRHHSKQKDHAALNHDKKSGSSKKQQDTTLNSLTSTTSSSTTTSDETIRRVNVSTKPPSGSSSSKLLPKSSLPFKYSSEFIPGTGKQPTQKASKKDFKIKSDDVFVVKKTEQSQPSSQK